MSTSERLGFTRRNTAVLAALLGGALAVLASLPAGARDSKEEEEKQHHEKTREEQRPAHAPAQAPSQGPPRGQAQAPAAAPRADQRQSARPAPAPEQRAEPRQDVRVNDNRFVDPRRMNEPAAQPRGVNPPGAAVVGPPRGFAGANARIQPPSLAFSASRPPPPNRVVERLNPGYRSYNWGGAQYYHQGGHWYRPYGGSYVIVTAPFGLFVPYLPDYYTTFWYGGSRYYMADDTYYLYEPDRHGYVVTDSPYGNDEVFDDGSVDSGGDGGGADRRDAELYVYPTRGQSPQQQADDKYECHRWAVDQAHYDPTNAPYRAEDRQQYDRALSACLTGRGYSVK
jgi:hypothetical protein